MKKLILALSSLVLLSACSGHLKSPAVSFGKKCSETENGQIAYSYVWLYDKEQGLEAKKDTCEKIATKKD
jgi:hypothetical protein|tara:strand:- start:317 stop:526 length:210 start_codon:yes stop_codon:yes gene_type:complete